MSRTVFILGAGASVEAGGPTMKTFLDVAEDVSRGDIPESLYKDFKAVFRAISALRGIYPKAWLDPENIESVFGAFEMARLTGRLGDLPAIEIPSLHDSMKRVITATLGRTIKFPVVGEGFIRGPEPYVGFAKLVARLKNKDASETVAVLTFNYDVALEVSAKGLLEFDYLLPSGPRNGGIPLMKLHGSVNWSKCPACGKVAAWEASQFLQNRRVYPGATSTCLDIAARLSEFVHCGGVQVSPQSFIVPPTWNKAEFHADLESVWRSAATELHDAERIVVIGYSLPEADQFFRYLFALGSTGEARLRKFLLFDPDESSDLVERYERLLGPLAKSRFVPISSRFGNCTARLATELGLG